MGRRTGDVLEDHLPRDVGLFGRRIFLAASFFLPLLVYILGLAPTAMWGDSSKYILQSLDFEWAYEAGRHPLYNFLAAIWANVVPITDPAVRLNLLSAVLGAFTSLVLFRLLCNLQIRSWIAFAVAVGFSFSHIMWTVCEMAESYPLTMLIFALTLLWFDQVVRHLRARRKLGIDWHPTAVILVMSLFCGFGIANFALNLAYVPVLLGAVGLLFLRHPGAKTGGMQLKAGGYIFGGLMLGTMIIWVPMGADVLRGTVSLEAALERALDSRYSNMPWNDPAAAAKGSIRLAAMTAYQFPSLLLIFIPAGVYAAWQQDRIRTLALLALAGGTTLFCSSYMIQRAMFIMLPTWMIFAIFAAQGMEWWAERRTLKPRPRWITAAICLIALTPLLAYPTTVITLEKLGENPVPAREVPYRDNLRYYLLPSKASVTGPERFAREAFEVAKPGDTILADFTAGSALWYAQVAQKLGQGVSVELSERYIGKRADLHSLLGRKSSNGQSVFFADDAIGAYPLDAIPAQFSLKDVGILFKISPIVDED